MQGMTLIMIEEKARSGTIRAKKDPTRGELATDLVELLDLLKKNVAHKGGPAHANDSHRKPEKPRRTARSKQEAA